jgi:hypothetical protein
MDKKLVGPSYQGHRRQVQVGQGRRCRRAGRQGQEAGGNRRLGPDPDAAERQGVADADVKTLVTWILGGAK